MTTTIDLPASPPQAAPPDLDFDTRLALRSAEMTIRLDQTALAFAVNTAHLPGADPIPHIAETTPLAPAPTGAPSPYNTPIADLLHRARARIETDGWCRDALFDESGAVCPIRAIRLEAHGDRHLADEACVHLLNSIQRHWNAETIPSWNAQQTSAAPVLLAFDQAANLAHSRQL